MTHYSIIPTVAFATAFLCLPGNAWGAGYTPPSSPGIHGAKSTSRKPSQRVPLPNSVTPHEDDPSFWISSWGPGSQVKFSVKDGHARIIWINKRGFPAYTGGQMIADSLRHVGASRPSTIMLTPITHPRTVSQLKTGTPASETPLGGTTLLNAVEELGGHISKWESEAEPYPWIKVTVTYP